jgi:hypothetical protein
MAAMEKLQCSGRNFLQCCFIHQVLHMDCHRPEPGMISASNHISDCMALMLRLTTQNFTSKAACCYYQQTISDHDMHLLSIKHRNDAVKLNAFCHAEYRCAKCSAYWAFKLTGFTESGYSKSNGMQCMRP